MKILTTIKKNIGWIALIVAVILISNLNILLGILLPSPLSYGDATFSIDTTERKVFGYDDPITINYTQCNVSPQALIGTVVRVVVNAETGDSEQYPPETIIVPPGCLESSQRVNALGRIPKSLPAGTYYFRAITAVQTEFRVYHIYWKTETFKYNPEKV